MDNTLVSANSEDLQYLSRQWYVLKVKPHMEVQVARILEAGEIQTFLPLLRRNRKTEPLFAGYLFHKINYPSDEYVFCRSAPGVNYILNYDGIPVPIADSFVQAIKQRLDIENSLSQEERFKQGDRVVLAKGALRDIEAIFDRSLTKRGRCQILLQILGRYSMVQVPIEYLIKVESR